MPKSKKAKVFFFTNDVAINIRKREKLKSFIENIFKREKQGLESISYIFCSDPYLLEINRKYLNHNYYTDIITFDLSENPSQKKADIFISVDRVRDNANQLGTTITKEIHRVIFHGALHLCGYKDKKATEVIKMRDRESFYLEKYFS